MSDFILVDTLQEKKGSKFKYFKTMTGIGPMYTDNINEAKRFESKQVAFQSPAYCFSMTFFEPVELSK